MYKPIIFLDIDGPINTVKNQQNERKAGRSTSSFKIKLPEETFIALKYIIDKTNAEVVISSNWRLGYQGETPSRAYINFCTQASKYGIVPIGWTPYVNKDKGLEIKSWLEKYRLKGNVFFNDYIIIEDHITTVLRWHKGHVIATNSYKGLTMDIAYIAVEVLRSIQKSNRSKKEFREWKNFIE